MAGSGGRSEKLAAAKLEEEEAEHRIRTRTEQKAGRAEAIKTLEAGLAALKKQYEEQTVSVAAQVKAHKERIVQFDKEIKQDQAKLKKAREKVAKHT